MTNVELLDERTQPDFRELYGRYARLASALAAAVGSIRLGGMTLDGQELHGLREIRILVGQVDTLTLSAEAESLAADPSRRRRPALLAHLIDQGRLQVRSAPLAGWSPDFSIFTPAETAQETPLGSSARPTLMMGTHWFERPYPHPGPAFGIVVHGRPAIRARTRFNEVWARAHDLNRPLLRILRQALRRTQSSPLTPSRSAGYS